MLLSLSISYLSLSNHLTFIAHTLSLTLSHLPSLNLNRSIYTPHLNHRISILPHLSITHTLRHLSIRSLATTHSSHRIQSEPIQDKSGKQYHTSTCLHHPFLSLTHSPTHTLTHAPTLLSRQFSFSITLPQYPEARLFCIRMCKVLLKAVAFIWHHFEC